MTINGGLDLDRVVNELIGRCEKYLVLDNIDRFYACVDEVAGSGWRKTDVVMSDDSGNMVRLLACKRVGDEVLSILAFYEVSDEGEEGVVYSGMDVDVSNVGDVRRVVGDLCG